MQDMLEKGREGVTWMLQGICWGLVSAPCTGHVIAIHVPGSWCPAGQETACLMGAKIEW